MEPDVTTVQFHNTAKKGIGNTDGLSYHGGVKVEVCSGDDK